MQVAIRNLLLIEDNIGDARLLREILRDAGDTQFHIEHVDRLDRGLERLSVAGIDVVLLDLTLPDTRGIETFNRVHAFVPHMPVIVMSGLDDEDLALEAVHSGAQDYLIKGRVTGPSLVRSMRYGIERAHLLAEAQAAQTEIAILNKRLRRTVAESHHRIKNSLQVLASLVEIQLVNGTDTVLIAELTRISQHIRGLGVIHDLLTREAKSSDGFHTLSSSAALQQLLPMLEAHSGERRITASVSEIILSTSQSTSLIILVNELISNAIKHGKGDISLTMRMNKDKVLLEVGDDGPGFPESFDPQRVANTGLELIESLTRWDLCGEVSYGNKAGGGAQVQVNFPLYPTAVVYS